MVVCKSTLCIINITCYSLDWKIWHLAEGTSLIEGFASQPGAVPDNMQRCTLNNAHGINYYKRFSLVIDCATDFVHFGAVDDGKVLTNLHHFPNDYIEIGSNGCGATLLALGSYRAR